jgi:hypothetical protein
MSEITSARSHSLIRKLMAALFLIMFSLGASAKITWSFEGTIPADKKDSIREAIRFAVKKYNRYANYDTHVYVAYDKNVPTADANYNGRIRFGGSISSRVAIHEMGHILGVGTYWKWNENISGGLWKGAAAKSLYSSYNAVLNADRMHFWPYGLNYDTELTGEEDIRRHVHAVGAMRQDMGLSNTSRN